MRAINTEGANKSKIKLELSEKVKKYSEEDKTKLRELIRKWFIKQQQQ
ncbi:hypothetical protein GAPWKB11_0823 [Gilliamella apicola]|nr:hypothetical protein GAPWKB11_0823 [Gilliamella apicola]